MADWLEILKGYVDTLESIIGTAADNADLATHADGIWITAIVDAGNTGACSGTYRYAEARK